LTSAAGSTGLVLAAGRKIGEIYGYHALTAVDQLRKDGVTPFIPKANQSNYEIVQGRVVNKNTKAIFFSDEASSLGDPNPTLISSITNSFSYKNFITLVSNSIGSMVHTCITKPMSGCIVMVLVVILQILLLLIEKLKPSQLIMPLLIMHWVILRRCG
jgi:fructose-specific component phosphotransferase system IIB-like protein